jgi:hypothetical protein
LLASPARSCRFPIRVQAALTALAFVLSSLIGLVHEANTKHVRCAEHGEMMHGDQAATTRAAMRPPAPGSVVHDTTVATIHRHEHCALTSTTRDSRVELRPPAIVPAPLAISDVADAPARVAAAHRGALYRTAPKTSPPA